MSGKSEADYEYDVALSFAGEDRAVAETLASLLRQDGVRVFYDLYEQAQLWGKDLYQHLTSVYRDKAQYCIVFASRPYAEKLWPRHELRQAQARAFQENREYLLLLRLDDTELPGVNATVGYVDLRKHDIQRVRQLVLAKVFGEEVDDEDLPELTWRGELVEFRGESVASFWPRKLEDAQGKTAYVVELPACGTARRSTNGRARPVMTAARSQASTTCQAVTQRSAQLVAGKRWDASASSSESGCLTRLERAGCRRPLSLNVPC